jgi:phosphate acyltransferase
VTKISIDAMGGDVGTSVTIAGAALAYERYPDLKFIFFGKEIEIGVLLSKHPNLRSVSHVVHCDYSVSMNDRPSYALRQGRWKSSMWKSIEAIKTGDADVCISAGNTGALMAMAKFCLRTLSSVERPAIAAIWPTIRGESIVLDVGASIGADAQQLVDFSVMGAAMARTLFGIERPTVGLLNVGVEEIKGQEEVKEAGRMLRDSQLKTLLYHGFVEGDDIGSGAVDVVVTEGFSGNIALKTAEGTAKQIAHYLRAAMQQTLMTRIGYFFAKGAFVFLKEKLDPRKVNGGVLLGLNGIVVKSHGGTDKVGFAAAIAVGRDMARNKLLTKIETDIENFHNRHSNLSPYDTGEVLTHTKNED